MLDADMPEEPCNFAAVEEGGHDWHVVVTVFAFGDIDFEYLGEHFAPPIVLYGIVIGTVLFECEAFWMSGFRVMFLRCGEFEAKTPAHFTRWDFGGGRPTKIYRWQHRAACYRRAGVGHQSIRLRCFDRKSIGRKPTNPRLDLITAMTTHRPRIWSMNSFAPSAKRTIGSTFSPKQS